MNCKEIFFLILILTLSSNLKAQTNTDSNRLQNILNQYATTQDSFKQVIINYKQRKDIINSVLQELYIRDAIELKNDSIYFDIYLNMHYWGCGAGDSYGHNLDFVIKDSNALTLPRTISIREVVDSNKTKPKIKKIAFELISFTDTNFVYHSEKHKRTLVIFKSHKYLAPAVWYFTNLTKATIEKYGIMELIEKSTETENDVPYRSTLFNNNEYEEIYKEKTKNLRHIDFSKFKGMTFCKMLRDSNIKGFDSYIWLPNPIENSFEIHLTYLDLTLEVRPKNNPEFTKALFLKNNFDINNDCNFEIESIIINK